MLSPNWSHKSILISNKNPLFRKQIPSEMGTYKGQVHLNKSDLATQICECILYLSSKSLP